MTAEASTANVAPTAVERLYGTTADLSTVLDRTADAPHDLWTGQRPAVSAGLTIDGVRDLWATEFPPLGDAEPAILDAALAAGWSGTRESAREAITAAYMGVVKRIVRSHTRLADAEDIRQTALVGLWKGLRAFDATKHRRPIATIERSILMELNDAHAARFGMKVPEEHRLAYAKARKAAADRIQVEQGDGLDLDDLAADLAPEFGLSTVNYWHVHRVVWLAVVEPNGEISTGLDSGDIDADGPEHAAQPDGAPMYADATPNVAQTAMVAALLDVLDDREREVVARYFGLDAYAAHTDEEIGTALSLTKQRIGQIRKAATAKLAASVAAPAE